jgi:hypothetical protein
MRNTFFSLLTAIIMLVVAGLGCKPDPPLVPEEDLRISTDAPSYTTTPGPDFNFKVKIESVVPPGGVEVENNVKSEIDNQNYPQGAMINTYGAIIPVTIILPRQKICICTVTVTSKTKRTNTATTSFRVVYK